MNPIGRRIKNRAGFTLVELLMVIAIIGVLATIALPEFQRYRARVYDATAMSDLAQFRNAIMDMETPVAFGVSQTTPGVHPSLPTVNISPNVHVSSFSFNMGGSTWLFMGWACHTAGDTGYRLYIPITGSDPWVGVFVPNEINVNQAHRAGVC